MDVCVLSEGKKENKWRRKQDPLIKLKELVVYLNHIKLKEKAITNDKYYVRPDRINCIMQKKNEFSVDQLAF